jgi:hypothetical protein
LVAVALLLLSVPPARAEPREVVDEPVDAEIEIEQAPGSEACPDKQAVFRAIERLFPERTVRQSAEASSSTARARVTIRSLPAGYEAVLTLLPPRRGERVIREEDEDCRGLADALALAFVMLVMPPEIPAEAGTASEAPKPGAAAASPSSDISAAAPPSKPSAPQNSGIPPRIEPPSAPRGRSYQGDIAASLVGGLGVLNKPAMGAGAEVELFHQSGWGFSVQGIRLWSRPVEAEGGSVALTLWGLLIAPCFRRRLSSASRLAACLRLGIGSEHAQVKGFLSPQSGDFPWMVLEPSIGYRQGFARLEDQLSGFVRIGAVGQLRPQSFSVRPADGSAPIVPVASATNIGVVTELGLVLGADLL